jgi:hypothetical protein
MSTYQDVLPGAFQYRVLATVRQTKDAVRFLMSGDAWFPHPNGSSFAVTSDTFQPGFQYLWLSRVSAERLKKGGIFEDDQLMVVA